MKYRYITCGTCKPSDPICHFRLISHRYIGSVQKEAGSIYIRVRIPDDLQLEKWSCDEYSTTEDTRSIKELGYNYVVTMWNGKRKVLSCGADDVVEFARKQFSKWVDNLYKEKGLR